jgi:transcriptional regulator with XRE-family HTH domain
VTRLTLKSEQQTLLRDLREYRLSQIEARAVYQRIQQYLAERESPGLAEGQIYYAAVAFGEPAGKPLAHCRLVRIRLTLDAPSDLEHLRPGGDGVPAMRRERLFRMVLEAVEQGARLTQEDFVRLLGVDVRTVRRIIGEFRRRGIYLPTRGHSQDIGRGTSHKAIAVQMYLQYATYSQIERKTGDTAASLIRYLKDFSAVVQALALGVPEAQIAVLTGLSPRLVGEYLELYRQYDPAEHQGVLERIRHPLVGGAAASAAGEKGGPC